MKKKLKNINLIFIIGIICMLCIPMKIEATEGDNLLSNITEGVETFQDMGENKVSELGITSSDLYEPLIAIGQILYAVGVVVAICYTIVLGIKYGTGSVNEKAGIKGKLLGWLVTTIILVAAPSIWLLIVSIADYL